MNRSFFLLNPGELRRKDNTLRFTNYDGVKKDIPIETVYDIYIFTDINFNADLIEFLGAKGVCVHFFNYYEFYSGTFYPREKLVSGDLLVRQVSHYIDIEKRLQLARLFVEGGADNILRNLKYYDNRGRELDEAITTIDALTSALDSCESVQAIMGIEGNIRKEYYACWNSIFNYKTDFDKRVKRPPDNMVNSLISFLNSLMYSKVLSEIYRTQLNPTISYLHEPSTKRFSLALDVSEIFKPLIIDRLIFNLINKNVITENDFVNDGLYLRLKENSVKTILQSLEEALSRTVTHRVLNQVVSYRHLVRLELYKLIKHLVGDKAYNPFKIWW